MNVASENLLKRNKMKRSAPQKLIEARSTLADLFEDLELGIAESTQMAAEAAAASPVGGKECTISICCVLTGDSVTM